MIMPFIRLVTIYVVVIVAVIAVFKRDQIMELAGWSFDSPSSAQGDPAPAVAPAVAPIVTPAPEQDSAVRAPLSSAPAPAPEPAPADVRAAQDLEIKQPTPTPAPAPIRASQSAAPQPAPQPVALSDGDLQTRLTEARRAYWGGDLAKSEALFAALAQDAPENPDVTGELGNILYAQRRYSEAADAYLATGKRLVGNGNPAQILPIIGVLQSIDPQKAETLRALASN